MAKVKSLSPSVADKCYGISRWLSTALSDHSFFNFNLLPTSAVFACGLASPDREMTDPEKVIKAADKKLYKAKKAGRNRTAH